jgi:hypothetical protein
LLEFHLVPGLLVDPVQALFYGVVLLLLCIALLFRLIATPWTFHFFEHYGEQQAESPAHEDSTGPGFLGDLPNWLQFVVAALMAIFSYWLFRLGKLQSLMLRRANRTAAAALNAADQANRAANRSAKAAEDANIETKRSVDAYIETERARLVVGNITEDLNMEERVMELHFIIENIGNGVATITGEWLHVKYFTGPAEMPVIDRAVKLDDVLVPVRKGQQITTIRSDVPRVLGAENRLPYKMPPRPRETTHFAFQAVLKYVTQFGTTYLSGTTYLATVATRTIVRVHTDEYTFDVPLRS